MHMDVNVEGGACLSGVEIGPGQPRVHGVHGGAAVPHPQLFCQAPGIHIEGPAVVEPAE
jgi:hypothetical protein